MNLKSNKPPVKTVVAKDITEEYSETPRKLDEEEIFNIEDVTKQPDKVNGKMEQPVDAEGITERSRENTENIFA